MIEPRALILPGLGGSGPAHWQSRWEALHPDFRRVEQSNWDEPELDDWLFSLDAAVASAGAHVVLVAHSLACLLVAHWAMEEIIPGTISGALLVAVPDPDGPAFPQAAATFAGVPMRRLPFPSVVVASEDDPYGSVDHATRCARAWGSRLVKVGAAGHINADSGLGDWPRGLELLGKLIPGL